MVDSFIKKNFQTRYCYKYKIHDYETCCCGNKKISHKVICDIKTEEWSLENNTELVPCESYGEIEFLGYDNKSKSHLSKFIKFYCNNEIEAAVYKLIASHWKFPTPKLIISVNGGYKRMNFKSNQQKKNFKQGLIDVIKRGTTWIIGGGFNVGIHKLVAEAVYDYRLLHDNENQVKLIGICTWGVVQDNDSLSSGRCKYQFNNTMKNKRVPLNAQYDCFLFCDDGTIDQYGKETNFRLKFENYLQYTKDEPFTVQVLYEGGKRAIENICSSLQKNIPLVVISGSGRAADIICQVLELPNYKKDVVKAILDEYRDPLNITNDEIYECQKYLSVIYLQHKQQIVVHDIWDRNMKLDKKILEAIFSGHDGRDLQTKLKLTIRFNCHDIAETTIFRNSRYSKLTPDELKDNFLEVLKLNLPEFLLLFLENDFDIERYLDQKTLAKLYRESINSDNSRCADLVYDLVLNEDRDGLHSDEKFLIIISNIICKLSGNILEKSSLHHTSNKERLERPISIQNNNLNRNPPHRQKNIVHKEGIQLTSLSIRNNNLNLNNAMHNLNSPLKIKDLFLWAIIFGHTDMAIILWKFGIDHISTALIGSIILNNLKDLLLKRGSMDISEKLSEASKKFQEMSIAVLDTAYEKSSSKAYTLLIRSQNHWNNLTCLQIAISGSLLDFLNHSACVSYTKKAWMGELSLLLSTWKILLTIPLCCIFIKPLVIPTFSQKDDIQPEDQVSRTPDISFTNSLVEKQRSAKKKQNVTFREAIIKFYQAPFVKFVIHFVSYLLFLMIFLYLNLVELQHEFDIDSMYTEIFVYVYVFGTLIEEIRQVYDQERTGFIHKLKAYLSGSWNIYDVSIISLFLFSLILRFSLSEKYFVFAQCFFAITFSMFCLRTLQFYLISSYIGPKVLMIRKMIVDVLFFLSIFLVFIISYGTLAQAILNPNSLMSSTLIKDVFFKPYFQTYGELMLDELYTDTNSTCETMRCRVKYTTVYFGFAVYLLLTNILLVNLLIAMFGHTFNKIQGESEKIFSFIQIQLVEEFSQKPLLPPPFNILYYIVRGILSFSHICSKRKSRRQNTFLFKPLPEGENIKIVGFEQYCMESAILEMPFSRDVRPMSTQNFKFENEPDFGDQTSEDMLNFSIKSQKAAYNRRLNSLEQQLEKFRFEK